MSFRFRRVFYTKLGKGVCMLTGAADEQTLFVCHDSKGVAAFDPGAYATRWKEFSRPWRDLRAIQVVDGCLLAAAWTSLRLVAIESNIPRMRWHVDGFDHFSVWNGGILVASAEAQQARLLDLADARTIWAVPLPATPSIRPHGDILVCGSIDKGPSWRGPLFGFDLKTHDVRWQTNVVDELWADASRAPDEHVALGPIGSDEDLLVLSTANRLMRVCTQTGRPLWRATMPAAVGPAWSIGKRILRASNTALYSFNIADGGLEYQRILTEPESEPGSLCFSVSGSLKLYRGHPVWVSRAGFALIDPETGDAVETLPSGSGVDEVIGNDVVSLGSYGEIRVFRGD